MDWKDIGNRVAKAAPLLGTLLGGPAGGAVGALVASALGTGGTADEVAVALQDPGAALKLREIEAKRQVDLQSLMVEHAKAELNASVSAAVEVNKTMQAEAAAEHWPTYTWRPFIGFIFGINLLIASLVTAGVYIAVMAGSAAAAAALGNLPAMIGALGAVNGAALPILGIASWFRGRMQADPSIPTTNKG